MTSGSGRVCSARVLLEGAARGEALLLGEPLSFWGGLDPETGRVIDQRHPRLGAEVAGRVLLMPAGRGSSSSSSVLAEALRLGTGPAAVLLLEPDQIVVLGALVAAELYGRACPVLVLEEGDYRSIREGDEVSIAAGGAVVVTPA